jgi:hypothetical protein
VHYVSQSTNPTVSSISDTYLGGSDTLPAGVRNADDAGVASTEITGVRSTAFAGVMSTAALGVLNTLESAAETDSFLSII